MFVFSDQSLFSGVRNCIGNEKNQNREEINCSNSEINAVKQKHPFELWEKFIISNTKKSDESQYLSTIFYKAYGTESKTSNQYITFNTQLCSFFEAISEFFRHLKNFHHEMLWKRHKLFLFSLQRRIFVWNVSWRFQINNKCSLKAIIKCQAFCVMSVYKTMLIYHEKKGPP